MITLAEDAIADCWMKISAQCTLVITKARRMLTSYTEGGENHNISAIVYIQMVCHSLNTTWSFLFLFRQNTEGQEKIY